MKFRDYVDDLVRRYETYYFYPECVRYLMIKPCLKFDLNMQFEDGINYAELNHLVQWAYAAEDMDYYDFEKHFNYYDWFMTDEQKESTKYLMDNKLKEIL